MTSDHCVTAFPSPAEDSGPGVHDTTVAACSHELYEQILGIGAPHLFSRPYSRPHASCVGLRFAANCPSDPSADVVLPLLPHHSPGPDDHHDSCTTNLHNALAAIGLKLTDDPLDYYTPSPFNLWMNVPLRTTAAASFADWWVGPDPRQKPGDFVLFRAEMNCVCAKPPPNPNTRARGGEGLPMMMRALP